MIASLHRTHIGLSTDFGSYKGLLWRRTGPELSLSVFYLLPTCLAVWLLDKWAGILVSVVSEVAWLVADHMAGHIYLKSVNDRSGHRAGDRLLCLMASTLQRHMGGSDIVARVGGEFALLLPATEAEHAQKVLSALKSQLVEETEQR